MYCKEYNAALNVDATNKSYYVYFVRHDGVLYYIGSGVLNRWRHVNSGTSHSYTLNKMHFAGVVFDIEVDPKVYTKQESMREESRMIAFHSPLLNKVGNGRNPVTNKGKVYAKFKSVYMREISKCKLRTSKVVLYKELLMPTLSFYDLYDLVHGIPMVVLQSGYLGTNPSRYREGVKLGLTPLLNTYVNVRRSGCTIFETIQPEGSNIIYLKFTDYFVGKLGLSGNVLNFNGYSDPKHFHLNKPKEVV